MNNIAHFLTQLAGAGGGTAQSNGLLGQDGLFSQGNSNGVQNFDFWKAVLAEGDSEATIEDVLNTNADTPIPAEAKTLLALLGGNNKINISDALSDVSSEGLKTIESELIVLKTILQNPNALKEFEQLKAEGLTIQQLTDRIDIVRKQIELLRTQRGEDEPLSLEALIAAGLSPSQITEVVRKVEELEVKLDRPITMDDFIAGVGGLIPNRGDNSLDTAFMTAFYAKIVEVTQAPDIYKPNVTLASELADDGSDNVVDQLNISDATEPTEDIATLLNAIDVGGEESADIISAAPAIATPLPQTSTSKEGQPVQAAQIADPITGKPPNIQNNSAGNNAGNQSGQSQNNHLQPNLNTTSLDGFALSDGSLLYTDGEAANFTVQASLPSSSTLQAANSLTNATQHAGHTHPATQMVSAKLQQGAQQGQNQTLTLYLEPADLGRVEVRMEFGPDKMLQTNILVEKPEALSLLQRDSFFLERSLLDAGLEVDSGGINFELAEDDQAFGQNNNRSGNNDSFGQGDNDNEDVSELIETTMTWNVNPETGHTHYNILA